MSITTKRNDDGSISVTLKGRSYDEIMREPILQACAANGVDQVTASAIADLAVEKATASHAD